MNFKIILKCVCALFCLCSTTLSAAIQNFQAGNVSTTTFNLFWQMGADDGLIDDLDIYMDADGTQAATDLGIEWYPIAGKADNLSPDAEARALEKDCVESMQLRKLQLVQISGANSNTDYYIRPTGTSVDLLKVHTAENTSFVKEARQLNIDFTGIDQAMTGVVVQLSSDSTAYPLFAVCGALEEKQAYFNLADFLDLDGTTQAQFSDNVHFEITIYDDLSYTENNGNITFDDSLQIASLSTFTMELDIQREHHHFTFEVIASQGAYNEFNVTVYAMDEEENIVTHFNSVATLSSNKTLDKGAGETPAFTNGVLENYAVNVAALGTCQLTMSLDTISGTSNLFYVSKTYDYWSHQVFPDGAANTASSEDYGNKGVSNLMRYAFRLDAINPPVNFNPMELFITHQAGKDYVKTRLYPSSQSPNVVYNIMKSNSLGDNSWESIYSFDNYQIDEDEEMIEVTDPEALEGDNSIAYFKLMIETK